MDLTTLEAAAAGALLPGAAAYLARGDASANVSAWLRLALRPHVLRDVSNVTTSTSLLGLATSSPVFVAPTATHALLHAGAEPATARAAAREEAIFCVSMASSRSLEEIARAAPDTIRFAQMYVLRDRGRTRALAERAAAAGYRALVVSVDGGAVPYATSDRDLAPDVQRLVDDFDPSVTVDDVAQLREWARLPVAVKGVVRGDDARRCVDAGVDAIYVSNHGGRIAPECVDTVCALVDVVEAVGDDAEVYVDGGIRSGVDVLRALALGADGVGVGRLVCWGLAVGGEDGAADVLRTLRAELARAMAFCGVASIDALERGVVLRSSA